MRIESDLSEIKSISALPKDIYNAMIHEVLATDPKDPSKPLLSQFGNAKITLTWRVIDGPYTDRKIPFNDIPYKGSNKDGSPLVPFQYAKLLEATKVSRECALCHNTGTDRFVRGTGDNGVEKGRIVCPYCMKPMQIIIDTDNLLGCKARIAVDVKKSTTSDKEFNEVKDFLPIDSSVVL